MIGRCALGAALLLWTAGGSLAAPREVKADTTTKALIFPTEAQFKTANHLAIGTDVQAQSARLTTLAGSSQIDLFLANPVVLGSVPLKLDVFKISRSGGSDVVFQQGLGVSGELDELWVTGGADANVMKLKNTNVAAFSALAFTDHNGKEKMAVGFGNTSAGHGFAGSGYIEVSDADNGGSGPGFGIWQSTTYGGALGYDHRPRLALLPTGELIFMQRDVPSGDPVTNQGYALLRIEHTTPVLTLGNTITGNGYGDFRGVDANAAIVLREAEANRNAYYSFGGSGIGVGHVFKTGTVRASQVQRLHISDDGVHIGGTTGETPIKRLRHSVATLVAGTVTVSDTQVTAFARIFVNRFTDGGTIGCSYSVTRSAGVSFTITSKNSSGATETGDTSVVAYEVLDL